tara:strand:- start:1735 stop:3207 length:1473 start_codon:yes stop_codon:yes gene_type:complete
MSYKHFNDIQYLYEEVQNVEIDQSELEEVTTILVGSMLSEGYSQNAILSYIRNADPIEIYERYSAASEHFVFFESYDDLPDDYAILTEDLNEEHSVDEFYYLCQEGLGRTIATVARRIGGRNLRSAGRGLKQFGKGLFGAVASPFKKAGKATWNFVKRISGKGKGTAKQLQIPGTSKWAMKSNSAKNWIKNNPVKATLGAGLVGGIPGAIVGGSVVNALNKGTKKPDPTPTPDPEDKKDENQIKIGTEIGRQGAEILQQQQKENEKENKKTIKDVKVKKITNPSGKELPKPKEVTKGSNLERMINKNVEIHGANKISHLRNQNAAFQAARKKGSGYTMDDFVKDFPNSNTAKERRQNNKTNHPDLDKVLGRTKSEDYDAYEIILDYLMETNQVTSVDEANHVMLEMDNQTIGQIVREFQNDYQPDQEQLVKSKPNPNIVNDQSILQGQQANANVDTKGGFPAANAITSNDAQVTRRQMKRENQQTAIKSP